MTSRISTAQAFDSSLSQLQRRQVELSEMQQQLTTGKRVNRASDDPTSAARAERALAKMQRADADKRGVEASRTLMSQTESSLGDAGELLQRARELIVSAGNPSFTDAERKGMATELRGLRQQLLSLANSGDAANGYLFGGQGSAQAPFVDAPGGVQFRGTEGERQIAGNEALPIALDGGSWMTARTGNGVFETSVTTSTGTAWIDAGRVVDPSVVTGSTYDIQFSVSGGQTTYSVLKDGVVTAQANVAFIAGSAIEVDGMAVVVSGAPAQGDAFQLAPASATLSVFDVLDKAAADLSASGKKGAEVTQDSMLNLRDIDQVMGRLQSMRSEVGDTLNRIDGVDNRLDGQKLQGETERSKAEDLDMVQAISDFQNKQSGYDAALKSYSMVQRLSLFQYLNT
jgi:flagellar hook-associated protein 3 FlgL